MGKSLSLDIRERIVSLVEVGHSCHEAVLSCVDGSFYARVNLSDFDVCRLRSCVRPFDAVDITAGLDEVRTLGPNQTSELVSPDNTSGCPNFSSF